MNTQRRLPLALNEPVLTYAPGSAERARLKAELDRMARETIEIPLYIGGCEIRTGNTRDVVMPHEHKTVLAKFHLAGREELRLATEAALAAKNDWEALSWESRAGVFLKAADLLAGPWREKLNAATMLGQSKNAYQAEIDAACEMIDFFRFNASFYESILSEQPISSSGVWNRLDYRPLEGFITAITPFNFTAIAGNLPAAPAMLGNTVVWKPSDTQMLSAHYTFQLLREAGLPLGVINMVAAEGPLTSEVLIRDPRLGGVHFTGSTPTFQSIWKTIGENIGNYRSYPRLVGETGGKDFVFAHPSADIEALRVALVRGAFEYQGQKCSAASRAYIPESLWKKLKPSLTSEINELKQGDVRDFKNFVNAVIDRRSFDKINSYLDFAKQAKDAHILAGGTSDGSVGYFVRPTLIETAVPHFKTMKEEIFGPVLTVYPYADGQLDETLSICDSTSPFALTGAIFAQDRNVIDSMSYRLRNAAGNFYINDKPTGAVVGQQPFGGARASGTNDKAGSHWNLTRFLSPRTIKENFNPPKSSSYPNFSES
ncbi:MAG: L-glutamate gamma-semialdehyde dehydrogenase [Proteobacteria bacterium]|nr:MAG: L-glutamate gamma-semialdehyde dehydrogenase [Pseudomonadota bacterium]